MSYNIRYGTARDGVNHWDRRKEFLVETIKAFGPDLLGTQETLAFQRDYLAEKLPEYAHLGVGREDGKEAGETVALFYRKARFAQRQGGHFWLSQSPEKVGSRSWDSSLPRMVTWVELRDNNDPKGRPLVFFNTHFDHRGKTARLESARLLRERIRTLGRNASVVVTGDFNAGEDSEPYRALFQSEKTRSPLIDTYRSVHPKRGSHEGTFSGFKVSATAGERIDWIGCSPDWKVHQAGIDHAQREGRTPSDHFPVTAILRPTQEDRKSPDRASPEAVKVGGSFEVTALRDIAYHSAKDADAIKHKLDLYLPKGHRDFPVLFFVHGGTWKSGDKKIYGLLGELFARNGIGTVITNYRLSPKVKHPAHIEDVARAFAWTHANIGKHGGRATELFVSGHSAGGHLVALLATDESYLKSCALGFDQIRGVLALSGVYAISDRAFPAQFGTDPEVCRKASPLSNINGKHAPFLLAYADNDYPTLGTLAKQMGKALQKARCEAMVLEVEQRDHISIIRNLATNKEADPLFQAMLKFIASRSSSKVTPRKSD